MSGFHGLSVGRVNVHDVHLGFGIGHERKHSPCVWIKLDDGFATHPKMLLVGPYGLVLQVRAFCYCSQHHTDGLVSAAAVSLFTSDIPPIPEGWANVMVSAGLWDAHNLGYNVHDFLEWNLSKAQYLSMKDALSKAGKKGMKSRWNKKKSDVNLGYNKGYNKSITLQSTSIDLNSPLSDSNPKSNGHTSSKRQMRAISEEDAPTSKHFELGKVLKVDVGPEWGKFKNYCLAHDKRYANFEAAFRNWITNAPEMKGGRRGLS